MSELRLRLIDDDRPDPAADAPAPIPFPSPPRDEGSLSSGGAGYEQEAAEDRAVRLAQQIERSLDDVQRRLDHVKDQLDGAFHLPTEDDLPPSAA